MAPWLKRDCSHVQGVKVKLFQDFTRLHRFFKQAHQRILSTVVDNLGIIRLRIAKPPRVLLPYQIFVGVAAPLASDVGGKN